LENLARNLDNLKLLRSLAEDELVNIVSLNKLCSNIKQNYHSIIDLISKLMRIQVSKEVEKRYKALKTSIEKLEEEVKEMHKKILSLLQ